MVDKILYDGICNCNCLNLFQNDLKNIKFTKNNPNYFENIKLKSSINIGIPKISENEQNSVEVNIYEGVNLLKK